MKDSELKFEPIYCLTGCTAVGKTELALRWAEENQAEIVNCDALLFYRGMDIGTAKPSLEERARVPHHLIDIASPLEPMDVGRYLDLAIEAVREIQSRGLRALVTGGSGFYLKAFFAPVVDRVSVSPEVAQRVAELMEEGLPCAVAELKARNPDGLDGLDTQNPRRVAKALERCMESGNTIGQLKQLFQSEQNPLLATAKRLTILERDKDELNRRIEQRVEAMLESGLLQETRRLLDEGIEANPSAARAIGYRESIAHLKGEIDLATLRERICVNTRRLAKKQRTWFRGQFPEQARRVNLTETGDVACSSLFEAQNP